MLKYVICDCAYLCRVYEQERQKSVALRSELRSLSNGTGDRTDKIRTYNFPQVALDSPLFFTSSACDSVMYQLLLRTASTCQLIPVRFFMFSYN
jgi:protein subunit release factor A